MPPIWYKSSIKCVLNEETVLLMFFSISELTSVFSFSLVKKKKKKGKFSNDEVTIKTVHSMENTQGCGPTVNAQNQICYTTAAVPGFPHLFLNI